MVINYTQDMLLEACGQLPGPTVNRIDQDHFAVSILLQPFNKDY